MEGDSNSSHWDEGASRRYLDYGRYFIPEREAQMRIVVDLIRGVQQPCSILELCCGEGLLAELLLGALPTARYRGLDGSALMLGRAGQRLSGYGERVRLSRFELADRSWRKLDYPAGAVVSMLAIHHLDGEGKWTLFRDIYGMLHHGGVFIVADMVEPLTSPGRDVAADAWDEVVRQRSITLDASTAGYDFFQREGWNTYRYPDPDDIDHPSPLFDQLKWLEAAGFTGIEVHFLQAGHALFSGWKPAEGK